MKLYEVQKLKSQNLHSMRFFASIAVIFAHSFIISTGTDKGEWLLKITHNQLGLGEFAVSIFFLCGGYLISKSIERLKTFRVFFIARLKRLLPPLALVTVMVMCMGVFFSVYTPKQYFSSIETWSYLLNVLFILVHNLPGVFENNPYLPTVNGSLWTLPLEFLCYLACYVLYRIGGMKKKKFGLTMPLVLAIIVVGKVVGSKVAIIDSAIRPCLLFYVGMAFWVYREYIELKVRWMLFAILGFAFTICFSIVDIGMVLFFPYIMFTIWFGIKQCPEWMGKMGNYSYGIYLWAFPIQQAIVAVNGEMSPYINIMISLPLATLLGVFTYEIAEKHIR